MKCRQSVTCENLLHPWIRGHRGISADVLVFWIRLAEVHGQRFWDSVMRRRSVRRDIDAKFRYRRTDGAKSAGSHHTDAPRSRRFRARGRTRTAPRPGSAYQPGRAGAIGHGRGGRAGAIGAIGHDPIQEQCVCLNQSGFGCVIVCNMVTSPR